MRGAVPPVTTRQLREPRRGCLRGRCRCRRRRWTTVRTALQSVHSDARGATHVRDKRQVREAGLCGGAGALLLGSGAHENRVRSPRHSQVQRRVLRHRDCAEQQTDAIAKPAARHGEELLTHVGTSLWADEHLVRVRVPVPSWYHGKWYAISNTAGDASFEPLHAGSRSAPRDSARWRTSRMPRWSR